MEKLKFSTLINAPREKVWDVLWDDKSYRDWTSAFAPGSYAETDWKQGSKALFLTPDGNGMVSEIAKSVPNEYLSIRHIGIVKGGVEDTDSEEVKKWAGALENYTLRGSHGVTYLVVDMDSNDEYSDFFAQVWPKALDRVKELAENK